jgi:flagellar basal-body rod protein FlgG
MASRSQSPLGMFRSLHVAATGMVAQETNLDSIANNLANANTVGYKRQEAQFEDLFYQTVRTPGAGNTGGGTNPSGLQVGAGARVVATARFFSQGPITQTGNNLDLAIEGAGFFQVQRPGGDAAFTRAGTLRADAQGRLVTTDGMLIEPALTLPTDATSVTIAADGTISATVAGSAAPTNVGQLQIATFANADGLLALGHNLFQGTPASGDARLGAPGTEGRGSIQQGALEGSNVEVVNEMIAMIRAQRAYEINSKVIQAADEMLRNATQAT